MAVTGRISYNATTGKKKLTTSGRHGYECAGPCSYVASDGSDHTDNFSSISGWSTNYNFSLASVAGRLEVTKDSHDGFLHNGGPWRTGPAFNPSYVNIECDVYDPGTASFPEVQLCGIGYDTSPNTPTGATYYFIANWTYTRYEIRWPGGAVQITSSTPTTGEKLSLELTRSAGDTEVCCFVDGTLLYSTVATSPGVLASSAQYGLLTDGGSAALSTPIVVGEYDDFLAQIDA